MLFGLLEIIFWTIVAATFVLKFYCLLTIRRCVSKVCLIGKTAIVTGGNSGIGYETALALAQRGCRVIIADKHIPEKTKAKMIYETQNENIVMKYLDLANFKSIRAFAKDIIETEKKLDILINNAGILDLCDKVTEDGLNLVMQVNFFGPFLLTHLLIGPMKKSAHSRIIFVSSHGAFVNNLKLENMNYLGKTQNAINNFLLYGNSKLCILVASKLFGEKLKGTGITCNSLHPGCAHTQLAANVAWYLGIEKLIQIIGWYIRFLIKTPEDSCQTSLHLAVAHEVRNITGKYFSECQITSTPSKLKDETFCENIWKTAEEVTLLDVKEKL